MGPKSSKSGAAKAVESRDARLKAALKDNLRKRKTQAKARKGSDKKES